MSLQSSCSGDSGRMTMWCYRLLLCSHRPLCLWSLQPDIHANRHAFHSILQGADLWICSLRSRNNSFVLQQAGRLFLSCRSEIRRPLEHKRCEFPQPASCEALSFVACNFCTCQSISRSCGFSSWILNFVRPDCMCVRPPLLWSTLMCDTDQQCQSPPAVTPVPPKASRNPSY